MTTGSLEDGDSPPPGVVAEHAIVLQDCQLRLAAAKNWPRGLSRACAHSS